MKYSLLLVLFLAAGCQSTPPPAQLPQPALLEVRPVPPVPLPPRNTALEQKVRQQAQFIEALVSQNDALTAKLTATNAPVRPPAAAAEQPAAVTPSPAPPVVNPVESYLLPNADGVVDLAAIANSPKAGEQTNPFVVRTAGAEPGREVKLTVSGILTGARPCAVINEHLISVGESVESLMVERIEDGAVVLRHDAGRVRLPISDQPVRVRLPL